MFKIFSIQVILKIFKFSFNLDQSQVCISNRLKVTACQSQPLFWAHDKILNHWKNSLSFLYLMKRLKIIFRAFFSQSNFEDFRIFFHSRPIPSLYLKRFKSYSSSKWNTSFLELFFSYGIVKTISDYFYSFFTTPKRLNIKNFFFLILKA